MGCSSSHQAEPLATAGSDTFSSDYITADGCDSFPLSSSNQLRNPSPPFVYKPGVCLEYVIQQVQWKE